MVITGSLLVELSIFFFVAAKETTEQGDSLPGTSSIIARSNIIF